MQWNIARFYLQKNFMTVSTKKYKNLILVEHVIIVKIIYLIKNVISLEWDTSNIQVFFQIHILLNLNFKKCTAFTAISQNNKMHKCNLKTTKCLSLINFIFFIFFVNDILSLKASRSMIFCHKILPKSSLLVMVKNIGN